MTRGLSAANVANKWLDAIRDGGASFTVVADTFVKLHVGDPGAAGTSNASANTTRVAVAQTSPSAGAMAITGTNPQWTNGGTSETLTDISVWDAITSGNFLYSVQLASGKAWTSGQTFTLTSLSVSVTPIAA